MIVRVGLPHRGGALAFHAFRREYPAMVSASAFWNGQAFILPDASDVQELDFALDSAGFTAVKLWQARGRQRGIGGIFPWTYEQYLECALCLSPTWWAQPDLCCEPEIARGDIAFRVSATATFLEGSLRILRSWSEQAGALYPSPVPIVQGWTIDDYLHSLELMLTIWARWHRGAPALIGVGSVCRRSRRSLLPILEALELHLPRGSRLHLFGVKGPALSALKMFPCVESVDSMAYDFRARMKARELGSSNSLDRRAAEMSHWMSAASARILPRAGDQLRLRLG